MKFILFFTFILASVYSKAQTPYNFYNLFLENGLSDARVADIVQDKYGFMWFATPNGLNRYDGYVIKNFNAGNNSNSLPSNNIMSLYSAKNGDLWIGTTKGVVTFNFATEKFSSFDTSYKEAAEVANLAISDITEDKNGNIYAATLKGIFSYTLANKKWINLNTNFSPEGTLRRIRRLKFFNDEVLIASTSGNLPIFKVNIKNNTLDSLVDKTDTLPPNMYGLEKLNDQEMLGGLLSSGFSRFNVNTKQFKIGAGALQYSDSIRYNSVYDILKDSRGRIWMASYYFRLAEYIPEKDTIISFQSDPYNPYGFEGNDALCIYEDRQHNIWIGTATKGVYRFNPDDNAVKLHEAIDRGSVFSLNNWDDKTLFVGTEAGPAFYNLQTGKSNIFKGISTMGINAPLEYVRAGIPDRNGKYFWMGTVRLGLMRYDRTTGNFKNFSRITKPKLLDDGITNLLQLADGNLFLIGFGKPLIFNTSNFTNISAYNDTSAIFKLKGVSSICYDGKSHIWLSTNAGKFYEYDPIANKLTDRTNLLNSFKELNEIHDIAFQNNRFYLATDAGLIILQPNAKPLIFLTDKPASNLLGVRAVLPDGDYVWFANSRRIGRLHTATGKILYPGEREGIHRMLLYPRTLLKSPQGNILIGSNKGYFEIFPNRLKENLLPQVPIITAFRIYDLPLQTNQAVSDLKEIELTYKQNFFSFDMSSLNYNVSEDVQYAYKLEGFDKDWQYIGKLRQGSYTNVPGGNYTLRLKAGNSSGQWVESAQKIKINISKHFLDSWWFWLALALAISAIAIGFYRRRVTRINKEANIRSDYEIKLIELENSALRTQMNPHFIFNSLNTINSFISKNETEQAHRYISKFSRLIRFILDHSRKRKILLSDELEVLNLYIQIERIRFDNKFDFEINIAEGLDVASLELPPLIIQPFVENAILHGLLPKNEKGKLSITIKQENDLLICIVEDNGIGREKAKALQENKWVSHQSHGIEITLKRIELFNKEHGKTDTVVITDLPEGTSVKIPVAWEESF